jgi:type IV pilus assembly protein PilC
MNFAYTAKSFSGSASNGMIVADTDADARQQLKQQGLFVLSLKLGRGAPRSSIARPAKAGAIAAIRGVSRSEVMMLTSQLAIMTRSGVDLAESIDSLATTVRNPQLAQALTAIHESLKEGVQLSVALAAWPGIFDEVFVTSIRAAEASGKMADVLDRLSTMLRVETRIRSTVVGALTYPAVLITVSSFVLVAIVFFVLPQFAKVFADIGVVPPVTTSFLLAVGAFAQSHSLAVIFGVVATGIAVTAGSQHKAFKSMLHMLWLNNPLTRTAARSLTTGRVFRLLGSMLQSGIPLHETLQLCANSVGSPQFRNLMQLLIDEVTLGHMIGPALNRSPFLPKGAAQMIMTAERTGQLSSVFEMTGEYYEQEGERQLQNRIKLLEPAVILVMGALVGFIVGSVMLPLFEFSSASAHS